GGVRVECVEVRLLPLSSAPVFLTALVACGLNEDAPHGLRGGREEVPAVLERPGPVAGQSEGRLVHQGGGVERLPRFLSRHMPGGEAVQLVVDEGPEPLCRPRLALLNGCEDLSYIVHAAGVEPRPRCGC